MNTFKSIRSRLGMTQAEIAKGIGVTQGNVSFYEKGQTVPPHVATKLIAFAKVKGHVVSYDEIYGEAKARKSHRRAETA